MSGNFTLFTNDQGSQQGSVEYVKDEFPDVSLPATNNNGLTSTASTNPLGQFFSDDDSVKYGAKTLWIKDLVLRQDRSTWINGQPTYDVIWNEPFVQAKGYVFGRAVHIRRLMASKWAQCHASTTAGNGTWGAGTAGFGIVGVIRRVAFLYKPQDIGYTSPIEPTTDQIKVDGANTSTVNVTAGAGYRTNVYRAYATGDDATVVGLPFHKHNRHAAFLHAATNETKDIHDFRIENIFSEPHLDATGVIVYYENSGQNIDVGPGTTYVNKNKNTTTGGGTLAIPTFGSSLGGRALIYKTTSNTYATAQNSAPSVASLGTGTSGSGSVTVTTGQGQSFKIGNGVVIDTGASFHVAAITGVSTDTLTISPVLPFDITSKLIYTSWFSGPTAAISASLYTPSFQFGGDEMAISRTYPQGFYQSENMDWAAAFITNITAPALNFVVPYGAKGAIGFSGAGMTFPNWMFAGQSYSQTHYVQSNFGAMVIGGNFQAADIELIPGYDQAAGVIAATMIFSVSVNGVPGYTLVESLNTMGNKKTLFTDAPQGWNQVVITGSTAFSFLKINMYRRSAPSGSTLGGLAEIDGNASFVNRSAVNASLMAIGTHQRLYGYNLNVAGATWVAASASGSTQGIVCSTDGAKFTQIYYGKHFAIVGSGGTSFLISVDGVSTASTLNAITQVATEGFHTVVYTHKAGTSQIYAFDYTKAYGGIKNVQGTTSIIGQTQTPFEPSEVSMDFGFNGSLVYGTSCFGSPRNANPYANLYQYGNAFVPLFDAGIGHNIIVNQKCMAEVVMSGFFDTGSLLQLFVTDSFFGNTGALVSAGQPKIDDRTRMFARGQSFTYGLAQASVITTLWPGDHVQLVTDGAVGSSFATGRSLYFSIKKVRDL